MLSCVLYGMICLNKSINSSAVVVVVVVVVVAVVVVVVVTPATIEAYY